MSAQSNARFLPITVQSHTPESDGSSAEFAKDFVVILLLGIVALVLFVAIFYFFTRFKNWLSPRLFEAKGNAASPADDPSPSFVTSAPAFALEEANRDAGSISWKSHLWGMYVDERKSILHSFFQKRIRIMGQLDPELVHTEERFVSPGDVEQGPKSLPGTLPELETPPNAIARKNSDETLEKANSALDTTDIQGICCICLLHYEQGEAVMTGTQCGHLYHFDCCQAWLARHDHCPYCRQEMLRPAEFRQAAVDELGEARVNQLLTQHFHFATSGPSPMLGPVL